MAMISLLRTPLGQLRFVAFLEGLSFILLLFFAMPMKYVAGQPEWVRAIGMAHGLLFLAYIPLAFRASLDGNWKLGKTILAMLASLIPFGAFWADKKLFRQQS